MNDKFKSNFIKKAENKYGEKYDYSRVEYKGFNKKVCIICPIHGEFWQTPENHLRGTGCPKCGIEQMKKSLTRTNEQFIEDAMSVHGYKYDYSKVKYANNHSNVCIICPKHGEFWQEASLHLKGCECPRCAKDKQRLSTEDFIKQAQKVHRNKYDYSKVEYVNNHSNVCIICPIHGEFWQTPNNHLEGKGCYKCGVDKTKESLYSDTETFIKKAKAIHGNKYDYSKVEYKHNQKKVCIICPKHGEFWMTPNNHIGASNKCGCPKCNMSKLEIFVANQLSENNIEYIHECNKNTFNWLGKQRLDFFIPKKNIAIECQGEQHFKAVSFDGKTNMNENLDKNIKNDEIKFNKCDENNIEIIYVVENKEHITNNDIYKHNNVYDKLEFAKWIKNEN